jgi:hypothetical protein
MFELSEVLVIVVLVAGVAGYIGYWLAEVILINKMISLLTEEELKKLDELKEKLENATDEDYDKLIAEASHQVNLKILKQELVDGQVFFYDMKDNFVCQGQSIEHTISNYIEQNKMNINTCVLDSTGDKFYIVDGKVTDKLK